MRIILYCTVFACASLAAAERRVSFRDELSERISRSPALRRELVKATADLVANTFFNRNIRTAQSPLIALQSTTNYMPLGVSLSLKENLEVLLRALKSAPRDDSLKVSNNFFSSNRGFGIFPGLLQDILYAANPREDRFDANDPSLVVQTTEGRLRGIRKEQNGAKYISFLGIPYAYVTKRFRAPNPPKPWSGIRNANVEKSYCPQKIVLLEQVAGNEDCLYLNIQTPSLNAKNLPTLVWVHGGGFKFGFGNSYFYGPEKLIRQNVIVASFNYRLGALGFLNTGTKDAPGNAGMKDMVAALRWLKNNIRSFGGDPEGITLYGVSSGATAVEFLSYSPMARGLFSKVILSGGSGLNDWAIARDPLKNAFRLGRYLGTNTTYVKDLVRYLRSVDQLAIVTATERLTYDEDPTDDFLPFVPSVEIPIQGEDIFLPDLPEKILRSGQYHQVPTMINFNDREGLIFLTRMTSNPRYLESFDRNLEFYLPIDILSQLENPFQRWDIVNKVRDFYFNGQPVGNNTILNLIYFLGDSRFLYGIYKSIKLRMETSKQPIYYSELAYDGELGSFKSHNNVLLNGVAHADDLGYVFTLPYSKIYQGRNKTTKTVSTRIVTMISNFLKYGNPTPAVTKLLPTIWHPIQSTESFDYLRITDNLEMKTNPNQNRYDFWSTIYTYQKYLLMSNN